MPSLWEGLSPSQEETAQALEDGAWVNETFPLLLCWRQVRALGRQAVLWWGHFTCSDVSKHVAGLFLFLS